MEDQIPSSTPPQANSQIPGQLTPELLEQMKKRARELAVAQYMAQQQAAPESPVEESRVPVITPNPQPQVVYVRRNLTVAELILILCLATGIVAIAQSAWKVLSNNLPRIEVQIR